MFALLSGKITDYYEEVTIRKGNKRCRVHDAVICSEELSWLQQQVEAYEKEQEALCRSVVAL